MMATVTDEEINKEVKIACARTQAGSGYIEVWKGTLQVCAFNSNNDSTAFWKSLASFEEQASEHGSMAREEAGMVAGMIASFHKWRLDLIKWEPLNTLRHEFNMIFI